MDTVTVFTNLTCNENCGFCNSRRPADDPAWANARRVRADIERALAGRPRTLVLTGGEPLLDRHLDDYIRLARRLGCRAILLETNGTLLAYAGRAERLREAGLSTVRVALNAWGDGPSDDITRLPGSFALTLEGILRAAAAGLEVEISVAVTARNRSRLAELPRRIVAWAPGIRRLILRVVTEAPREWVLPMADASAAVAETARACREVGIEAAFDPRHAIPLCGFPARRKFPELFVVGPPQEGHGYERIDACSRCIARPLCPGVHGSYLAAHGVPRVAPLTAEEERFVRGLGGGRADLTERELRAEARFVDGDTEGLERVLRVNFHCNQDCRFCFVNRQLPAVSRERLEAEIEAAARDGVALLSLSGGEPTLNPHLEDYIRLAVRHRLRVQIQTNAIRCADAGYVRRLREAGLAEAFVSLHAASAQLSDAITGAPGTFAHTVQGVRNLLDAGVTVRLNCVITGRNYRHLPELVRFVAEELGTAPVINFSFAHASTDLVPVDADVLPTFAAVRPHLAAAIAICRRVGLVYRGLDGQCGAPLCALEPDWLDPERVPQVEGPNPPPGFVKAPACDACALGSRCVGVRESYATLHGLGEVAPIARGTADRSRRPGDLLV